MYFQIEPLVLVLKDQYYSHNVILQNTSRKTFAYFAKLVFYYDSASKMYRMHIQFWKDDDIIPTTSKILNYYEKDCMSYLAQFFYENGYVLYSDKNSIVLRTIQPHRFAAVPKMNKKLFLTIVTQVQIYLQKLNYTLMKNFQCGLCSKHLLLNQKLGFVVPPFLLFYNKNFQLLTDSDYEYDQEQRKMIKMPQNFVLHEQCLCEYLNNNKLIWKVQDKQTTN